MAIIPRGFKMSPRGSRRASDSESRGCLSYDVGRMNTIDQDSAPAAGLSVAQRWLPALLLLFIGSGCAALIYEVVWFQLLQLSIGSSAVSLGVLSANGSLLQVIHAGAGSDAMQGLPWSVVPTVLVPAFLVLHAVIYVQLRRAGRIVGAARPALARV